MADLKTSYGCAAHLRETSAIRASDSAVATGTGERTLVISLTPPWDLPGSRERTSASHSRLPNGTTIRTPTSISEPNFAGIA